jgi:hypothetical protein
MDDNERVTRLEVEFEYVRRDLDEIKTDMKDLLKVQGEIRQEMGEIRGELAKRPTTAQFWGLIASVAVIALSVVILIVGGMSYLKG